MAPRAETIAARGTNSSGNRVEFAHRTSSGGGRGAYVRAMDHVGWGRWATAVLAVGLGGPGCIIVSSRPDAGVAVVVDSGAAPVDAGVDRDGATTDLGGDAATADTAAPLDVPFDDAGVLDARSMDAIADVVAADGTAADTATADVTTDRGTSPDVPAPSDAAGDAAASGDASLAGFGAALDGWLEVYRHGGTIDYDRDGRVDVTVTVAADGTQTIVVAGPRGPRVRTTMRSSVDYDESVDDNGDGTMDITRHASVVAGVPTTVVTSDRNVDGTPDHRVTQTPHTSTVEDWLPNAARTASSWVVTSSQVLRGDFQTFTPCPPMPPLPPAPEPPTPTGPLDYCSARDCSLRCLTRSRTVLDAVSDPTASTTPGAAVRILTHGDPSYACTSTQAHAIELALVAAAADLERIRQVNPDRHNRLMEQLSRVQLYIGCGMPACVGTSIDAWTEGPRHRVWGDTTTAAMFLYAGPGSALNLPNASVRGPAVRELIEHEFFHLFESHEDGGSGFEQRDHIYGCSRLAVQWRAGFEYYLGVASQASSARDAAACASLDNKPRYGVGRANLRTGRNFFETAPGAEMEPPLCSVDDHTDPSELPTCAIETFSVYCDQTLVPTPLRALSQLHQTACTLVCPPGTPYQGARCPATVVSLEPYDRIGDVCRPVEGATY